MHHFAQATLAIGMLALSQVPSLALTPLPTQNITQVPDGKSEPFVGEWAVVMQSNEVGKPGTTFSTCALPVRIDAADDTHIFQLGPNEKEVDAAIELTEVDRRTTWEPIAGGPSYVAVWISPGRFNLYEAYAVAEQDWTQPMIYTRCD